MVLNKILEFTTTQCDVIVCDTGTYVLGERLYTIESYHRKNKKSNVRFGTAQQLYSLLIPYQFSVLTNKNSYESLLNDLSIRRVS